MTNDHKPKNPGRRKYFDYLLASSAFATLGAILYPIFRFIVPPQIPRGQWQRFP